MAKKKKNPAEILKGWRIRIVGEGEKPASEFNPHELNFRIHSKIQKAALVSILGEVGWVQRVLINRASGKILDGHARVEEALVLGAETPVPFIEVDLSEKEERLILATLDPIGALAGTDAERFEELAAGVETNEQNLLDVINSILQPVPEPEEPDETPNLSDSDFNYVSQYGVIVECESEIHQKQIFDRLSAEGLKVKIVVV